MGSAAVVPPPSASALRVYYLTSAAYAVNNIAMRRLKLSRLGDLNDPYEGLVAKWHRVALRDRVQRIRDDYDKATGLLCFSSDWTSPVLWSHYGDKHRGVCLGFDVLRSAAKSITYQAERLSLTLSELENPKQPDDLQTKLLFTKYEHWRYEAEVRLLVPLSACIKEGALHFVPFHRRQLRLREVILGDRCSLNAKEIKTLTSSMPSSPKTFRARLAGKSYNVVPDEDTV